MGVKWETSVASCGPAHPEQPEQERDKWETSVASYSPEHPEQVKEKWESTPTAIIAG